MTIHKWALMGTLLLGTCACKVDLYSELNQKEANEMLAILLERGIDCEKARGKEDLWTLRVEKKAIAAAVGSLKSQGYPRDQFADIGNIFEKEGLISSPLEERIRFIYALSQELSATISQIDGVLTSRVHIVLPENNPLSDNINPSSASVFIKYRQDSDVAAKIPQIKHLVVNSIEGLAYERVTMALFPGQTPMPPPPLSFKSLAGIRVETTSAPAFLAMGTGLLLTLGAVAMTCLHFYRLTLRLRREEP